MTAGTGGSSKDSSSDKRHITIALSATITAIWGGLWGFNWAASHLESGQLFVAIIIGLAVGTGMTVYVVEKTFNAIAGAVDGDAEVEVRAVPGRPP